MITVDLEGKPNGGYLAWDWHCPLCEHYLWLNSDYKYLINLAIIHLSVEHRVTDAQLREGSMKVSYVMLSGHRSQAYLEEEPLSDGSYVGINKHSDLPVHLRPVTDGWVTVCERDATPINVYTDEWEIDPKPEGCTCNERVTK